MGIIIGSCVPDEPEPLETAIATSYGVGRRVVYGKLEVFRADAINLIKRRTREVEVSDFPKTP